MTRLGVPPFICPRCRGPVQHAPQAYRCEPCRATYPVVAGVPDFRVAPDPWIGLEDDRAKALRLEVATAGLSFEESVRAYWAMTPATPQPLAARYTTHVIKARDRSAEWLARLPVESDPDEETLWLDLGCGTGDLIAAATAVGRRVVGIDIALRWLVIARRRPELAAACLVCCGAEALPFPAACFTRAHALGLLEHCPAPDPVLREARRVLRPGGRIFVRTVNRYTVLREPHVLIWGVGFVPRRWADRYVKWRSGRGYEHHRPLSKRELAGALRRAGFRRLTVGAAPALAAEVERLGTVGRRLSTVYAAARRTPVVERALAWVAPLLEASGATA